jgi:hypothetical protein
MALDTYTSVYDATVANGALTPIEKRVAFQAINVLYGCAYCTAGHTYLSRAVNMPEDVIAVLRESRPIESVAKLSRFACFPRLWCASAGSRSMPSSLRASPVLRRKRRLRSESI